MEESIKWDDSRDEIMDIIEVVEDINEFKIPLMCPICNTSNAHIYICIDVKMVEAQYGHGVVTVNHVHTQVECNYPTGGKMQIL